MIAHVPGPAERVEEDEARGDGGVQHAEEDERRDHKAEGHFLVHLVAERSKRRCDVVVRPRVRVDDRADEAEQYDFGDGDGPQRLGELARVPHLRDERGQHDLPDEGVADVEKGVHASDERRAFSGDGEDLRGTEGRPGRVAARVRLDTSEDCSQQDGDEGEEGGKNGEAGEGAECSWQGEYPGSDSHNGREADRADAVIGNGVEVFGSDKAVETLDEGVVENEHDGCEIPGPFGIPEQYLPNIADVLELWMAESKFPKLISEPSGLI